MHDTTFYRCDSCWCNLIHFLLNVMHVSHDSVDVYKLCYTCDVCGKNNLKCSAICDACDRVASSDAVMYEMVWLNTFCYL
jgi:hypothetical protein